MRWFLTALIMLSTGCTSHYISQNRNGIKVYLKSEKARQVQFVSSLNDFSPLMMKTKSENEWILDLKNTKRGFRYFYLVNGSYYLPECSLKEKDDFGTENCVYEPN